VASALAELTALLTLEPTASVALEIADPASPVTLENPDPISCVMLPAPWVAWLNALPASLATEVTKEPTSVMEAAPLAREVAMDSMAEPASPPAPVTALTTSDAMLPTSMVWGIAETVRARKEVVRIVYLIFAVWWISFR
jgi:hypothetical protein